MSIQYQIIWFFLKNHWDINEEIIKTRTNMSMKDFLTQCILELEKMNDRGILSGLGELLDAQQKVWVKKHLRQETIFLLKMKSKEIA